MKYPEHLLFCAKELKDAGIKPEDYFDMISYHLGDLQSSYVIVKRDKKPFFTELAEKLRELWPPGEKDGKYPWRDSPDNLSRRLMHLWAIRFSTKSYSIEECLTVARKYLARFEDDTTYMKTLKYFILKQTKIMNDNGKVTIHNESVFADMLESGEGMVPTDMYEYSGDSTFTEEGELI